MNATQTQKGENKMKKVHEKHGHTLYQDEITNRWVVEYDVVNEYGWTTFTTDFGSYKAAVDFAENN